MNAHIKISLAAILLSAIAIFHTSLSVPDLYSIYDRKLTKETAKLFGTEADLSTVMEDINGEAYREITKDGKCNAVAYIRRAKGCKIGGCNIHGASDTEAYEHFDYMLIIDSSYRVVKVKVLDYRPEQGYEICGNGWLKQFRTKSSKEIQYGQTIDAISGATTSAMSITEDIKLKLQHIESTRSFCME